MSSGEWGLLVTGGPSKLGLDADHCAECWVSSVHHNPQKLPAMIHLVSTTQVSHPSLLAPAGQALHLAALFRGMLTLQHLPCQHSAGSRTNAEKSHSKWPAAWLAPLGAEAISRLGHPLLSGPQGGLLD